MGREIGFFLSKSQKNRPLFFKLLSVICLKWKKMITRNNLFLLLSLILLVQAALFGCSPVDQPPNQTAEQLPVRFTTVHFIGEAPSYIAYHNGYFQQEGVEITMEISPAGNASLEKLFNGETDIITIADTPLVYAGFERDDFVIFGSIVQSDRIAAAVARRDSGINSPQDIIGKRVALTQGTASDFFMATFFSAHGIHYSDVEIISMTPAEQITAISNGDIDVMFNWQPNVLNVMNELGNNGYLLPTDGMKPMEWLLVTRRDFAEENPEVLVRFLKGMQRAESFIVTDEKAAIALQAQEIEMDPDLLSSLWPDISWTLSLDEALLINLENQARWAIETGQVSTENVPNYLNLIYFNALAEVKPEAITIIR